MVNVILSYRYTIEKLAARTKKDQGGECMAYASVLESIGTRFSKGAESIALGYDMDE